MHKTEDSYDIDEALAELIEKYGIDESHVVSQSPKGTKKRAKKSNEEDDESPKKKVKKTEIVVEEKNRLEL